MRARRLAVCRGVDFAERLRESDNDGLNGDVEMRDWGSCSMIMLVDLIVVKYFSYDTI